MPVLSRRRREQEAAIEAVEPITQRLQAVETVQGAVAVPQRGGIIQFKITVAPHLVVQWTNGVGIFTERGRTTATRQQRIDMAVTVLGLPDDHGLNAEEHDVLLSYV